MSPSVSTSQKLTVTLGVMDESELGDIILVYLAYGSRASRCIFLLQGKPYTRPTLHYLRTLER